MRLPFLLMFVAVSSCTTLDNSLVGRNEHPVIKARMTVVSANREAVAAEIEVVNSETFSLCLPELFMTPTGSNFQVFLASGAPLQENVTEDIVPKRQQWNRVLRPTESLSFRVEVRSAAMADSAETAFRLRYEATAFRCAVGERRALLPYPPGKGVETVVIQSDEIPFSK